MGRLRWCLRAGVAVYWVVLFTLTHVPVAAPGGLPGKDKLMHAVAYFLLAAGLYAAIVVGRPRARWVGVLVVVLSLAYGALDELTQPYVGRTCELADWLADAVGVLAAVGVGEIVRWSWLRRLDAVADGATMPA